MIIIGIDPHMGSLTASSVDATVAELDCRRFAVNAVTFTNLMTWAEKWPNRQFAVEGTHGLGRGIAQQLAAAGERVVDVPPTLARCVRLLSAGGGHGLISQR